ncbi:type II toxin-antitoxin system HicB family antitoxin [Streptococcus pluranimalium]|uniref:type II toxin-antitoxin system HicB family antitoxin n=1 Tax=Streptococcus pluranimalium TaxID=82348 RepID=UPI003F66984D
MFLYYAVFNFEPDGINITFPDLDGAFSSGSDMHEALYMAKDLLEGWLIFAEDDDEDIPVASSFEDIQKQYPTDLIVPVEVNLDLAREKHFGKPVKKTLTIPSYINAIAIENGINFSQVLTEALKDKLNA